MKVADNFLGNGRLGLLSVSQDHARSKDDGLLKVHFFDGILDSYLHLAVRHVGAQETSRPRTRDEDIGLHACCLCSLCILDAQIMVDLPLILDTTCYGSCGTYGVEDDRWLRTEGGNHATPFRCIGFLDGFELR